MADDGTFAVNIDDLKSGGVDFERLATMIQSIHGNLNRVRAQYGHTLGGNDPVNQSFVVNYYPAADDSEQFLLGLVDLVDTHGGKTISLGNLFGDVDDATITEANVGGHGRKA